MLHRRRASPSSSVSATTTTTTTLTTTTAIMRTGSLLLPLLLVLLAGAVTTTTAESTKACIIRIGDHVMDLTPLASTQWPLEYDSPDGRHTYRAAVCGAASVLGDSCKVRSAWIISCMGVCDFLHIVLTNIQPNHTSIFSQVTDAVAGSKNACEVYGRASMGGKPTFIDHGNPQHGVTITYAGGR